MITLEKGNRVLQLKRRDGKVKVLQPYQWLRDRNTPVGEDADLYEVKPYGGRRLIDRKEIVK